MKIALFEPYSPELIRGNSIAAERLARNLQKHPIRVHTFSLRSTEGKNEILKTIKLFKPDILHGFHACKTGPLVTELSRKLRIPYIISLRGTDAYEDAFKRPSCTKMASVLQDSNAVVVFHTFMKKTLLGNFPFVRNKITIIPQGVELAASQQKLHVKTQPQGTFVFGYAGGLRKLKGVHQIIKNLKIAHQIHPFIHLYVAGPVIEKSYARQILSQIKKHAWITYLGEIPHERMACFYALIDAYINASSSEGTSNAVLEALASGKCVLSSDIEGNRAVIKNGKAGFLYRASEDFIEKAIFMIKHRKTCSEMAQQAKYDMRKLHSASLEAQNYRRLYARCIPRQSLTNSSYPL